MIADHLSYSYNNGKYSISAVVPVYNGEKFIERVILSLLYQSHPLDEVIVVDDGSVDQTFNIISNYPIKVVRHHKNLGLSAARNTGIREARSDIVAFFDSDTYIPVHYVERLLDYYRPEIKYAGVGGREQPIFKNGISNEYRIRYMIQGSASSGLVENSPLHGLAMSFWSESLHQVGGFDPRFRTNGEDVEISLRLIGSGYKLLYDPSLYVYHYKSETFRSLIRTTFKYLYYGWLARYKNSQVGGQRVLNPRTIRRIPKSLKDSLPKEWKYLLLVYPFVLLSVTFAYLCFLTNRKKFLQE